MTYQWTTILGLDMLVYKAGGAVGRAGDEGQEESCVATARAGFSRGEVAVQFPRGAECCRGVGKILSRVLRSEEHTEQVGSPLHPCLLGASIADVNFRSSPPRELAHHVLHGMPVLTS